VALIRWLIFILIGLPFQLVMLALYPLVYLYWQIAIYKTPTGDKILAQHEQNLPDPGYRANGLLNNPDDHGAFSMFGALSKSAMELLMDSEGNFLRRYEDDGNHNRQWVSGDVVASWCFAFTTMTDKPVDALMKAAKNYLKYLGTRSYDEYGQGHVSARCNNFGLNYCPDSDSLKIGQPAAGPQFWTSSSLFALASQHSFLFKIVFWAHWLLMGGWYWCWMPMVYTNETQLFYVRDISMKALYVHKTVFGNRWWIRMPMETITYELSNIRNDLWYAMMGLKPVSPVPEVMDSFFSQKEDCTSRMNDRLNPKLGSAINNLADQAKNIK